MQSCGLCDKFARKFVGKALPDEIGEEFFCIVAGGFFGDNFFDFRSFITRGVGERFCDEVTVDTFGGEFLFEAAARDAFFDEAIFYIPSGESTVVEIVFSDELGDDFFNVGVSVV